MKQESFSDVEYSSRRKKTKREEFLEIMDEIIPWEEWVGIIRPYGAGRAARAWPRRRPSGRSRDHPERKRGFLVPLVPPQGLPAGTFHSVHKACGNCGFCFL